MDTKEKRRKPAAKGKKTAQRARRSPVKPAPDSGTRRRKTGAPNTPGREERQRRVESRRKTGTPNQTQRQRVIRPPKEEIPKVVYTAPKPLRRGRFLWKLVSMAAVVAAVFLGLSVFFRVETIMVAGSDKYSPWMIRQAADIAPGDPLLSIREARIASRIISDLPYVDEVKVGIRLPGTVEIQVTELQVTYSIEDESGSWWLISSEGRAVERVSQEKAMGYTRAVGIAIRTPEPGKQVEAIPGKITDPVDGTSIDQEQGEADDRLQALIEVMTALENGRIIGEVATIEVTDLTNIRLEYPQLLTVLLGDTERLGYKVGYLSAALKQLDARQSGVLDVSFAYAEDAIFTPKR